MILFTARGWQRCCSNGSALLAVRSGFTRCWAITHADNQAMRDVFQQSGFACEERSDRGGEIEVDLSIIPDGASVNRLEARHRLRR